MSIPKASGAAESFSVTIVACAAIPPAAAAGTGGHQCQQQQQTAGSSNNNLVYAVMVTQPVQSWTVVRSHEDFISLETGLTPNLAALPPCPQLSGLEDFGDINTVIRVRNDLQNWLTSVLMYPGANETVTVHNFLTVGANTIPPQYEGIVWTQFNAVLQPPPQAPLSPAMPSSPAHSTATHKANNVNVDDMEMDDMFCLNEEEHNGVIGADQDNDDDDDQEEDEDFIPAASVRYKPTDEAVTDEDEMEILQDAGEVEMIEDIGSLAQSLGASHLGRSLQLQAEMKHLQNHRNQQAGGGSGIPPRSNNQQQGGCGGVNIIGSSGGVVQQAPVVPKMGGIGGAMERAANNAAAPFNHKPPVSAPRLDSFKMIKVIGKGSFGKVFLVKEIKTSEIYALKVLRKDNIIKRNQVEHTNTERSVLGYVRHPFIVGMNMAFQSKDKLYFVLDYCAGGELFFHLGKLGKFPEPRARFYAAEIILAISYVHSLDIVYRDLKPENVLLDAQGHIRLTDFGLSKEGISSSSSGANSFCGTPEYLAPEILNRQGHGRAVDWWSLGALLYEMITGLPPFYCQDRERLFEKIRKAELHYPASVSRPAKKVLVGLLTKDPNRRLGSGVTDADEIKVKEFFSELDFDKLMKGDVPPPWKPNISGSLDTSQFDKEFTKMPVFSPQSMQRTHGFGATPDDSLFQGFTFTDRRFQHGSGRHAGV